MSVLFGMARASSSPQISISPTAIPPTAMPEINAAASSTQNTISSVATLHTAPNYSG